MTYYAIHTECTPSRFTSSIAIDQQLFLQIVHIRVARQSAFPIDLSPRPPGCPVLRLETAHVFVFLRTTLTSWCYRKHRYPQASRLAERKEKVRYPRVFSTCRIVPTPAHVLLRVSGRRVCTEVSVADLDAGNATVMEGSRRESVQDNRWVSLRSVEVIVANKRADDDRFCRHSDRPTVTRRARKKRSPGLDAQLLLDLQKCFTGCKILAFVVMHLMAEESRMRVLIYARTGKDFLAVSTVPVILTPSAITVCVDTGLGRGTETSREAGAKP